MNMLLFAGLANPNVNITSILPEVIVAVTGLIVMLYDCFAPKQRAVTGFLSIAGLVAAGFALLSQWSGTPDPNAWNGMVATDSLRLSFSFVALLVSALTILISTVWVDREALHSGEYHSILLFATVGMLFMSSANDFVIIFLGLETLSIATYVMAGLRKRDEKSTESALKYFVLGSFASAFLLYGMALIYGATGTMNITEIAAKAANPNFPGLLLAGAAMMVIGFGFKIATVPFHVWTPDVYEGAPSPITGFMAAGPKAAGFASFIRVFVFAFPIGAIASASGIMHDVWITVVTVLAILTMTIGNLTAIVQNNIKRLLAYSSISHAGYALIGLLGAGVAKTVAARDEAVAAVAFYLLTYAITTMGAFAIITILAQKNDRRAEIEDFTGIGFKTPVLAFSLSLFMLSLFGLPLTAGFIGKILVFRPAVESGNTLLLIAVIVAVINSAISAYYYLRLIVVMFFRERTTEFTEPRIPAALAAVLIITVLGVFYFGLFGNSIIQKFKQSPVAAQVK